MNIIHNIIAWYFSKKALPYWCILCLDCILIIGSGMVGIYLAQGGTPLQSSGFWRCLLELVCFLPLYVLGMRLFHTYSGVLRYSSFVDLARVGGALITGSILNYCLFLSMPDSVFPHFRIKSFVFLVCIALVLMWSVRILVKTLFISAYKVNNATRVFIYGVREGGISLAKSMMNEDKSEYVIKGFVDDHNEMVGRFLMGQKVYRPDKHLVDTMVNAGVKVIYISPLCTKSFRDNQDLVDRISDAGIKIMMMPSAQTWDGKSKLSYQQLKEVDIEDLLPRDEIEVDMKSVGDLLSGKVILITGAAGSIGSEMSRQVADFRPSYLILVDQAETPMHDVRLYMMREHPDLKCETIVTSITNQKRMEAIFKEFRPDYVFHAAAYKHVPMMENNPSEAVQNNVYGTRVIADLSVKYDVKKFVMISTDKAVNPTNVMGCSKRICEIYCQSLNKAIVDGKVKGITQFVTTRFGNVLGSNGSVIPLFKEQISKGGPVTVTHPDIIRFFMLIPEACKLVLEAGTMGKGGEIFVFDMGKPVRIADLAKRMIKLSGATDVEIKFTGLRDGEKLYEEVLNDAETTKPTMHPKIMVAAVREYEYEDAVKQEQRLYDASFAFDDMGTVKIMKEIVPEFKSRHSKYEALD